MTKNNNQPAGLSYVFLFLFFCFVFSLFVFSLPFSVIFVFFLSMISDLRASNLQTTNALGREAEVVIR